MPVADYAQNTSGVTLNGVLQAIVDLVESTDHSPYARNTSGATTLDGILDAIKDLVAGDDNSPYARNTNGTATIDGVLDALTDLVTADDNSPYARNTNGSTTIDGILDVLTDAVTAADSSPYGRSTGGTTTIDGVLDALIDALDGGALAGLPDAPVLTWTSSTTVNPPILSAAFDEFHVWPAGSIDASNFDRIELQIDDDIAFGSAGDTTNDLDAAEILAGAVDMSTGTQVAGVPLYARVRHHHYVGGVAHTSAWSNVETKTLVDVTGGLAVWFDGLPFPIINNSGAPTGGVKIWFDGLPIGLTS